MPALEMLDRYQPALLWEALGSDAYGQPARSPTPEEIRVRWTRRQAQALDPQGNTITVDVTVVVFQDVPIGSLMWLGSLTTLQESVPGTSYYPESDVYEVVTNSDAPDLKNRVRAFSVGLKRYRDALGTAGDSA